MCVGGCGWVGGWVRGCVCVCVCVRVCTCTCACACWLCWRGSWRLDALPLSPSLSLSRMLFQHARARTHTHTHTPVSLPPSRPVFTLSLSALLSSHNTLAPFPPPVAYRSGRCVIGTWSGRTSVSTTPRKPTSTSQVPLPPSLASTASTLHPIRSDQTGLAAVPSKPDWV